MPFSRPRTRTASTISCDMRQSPRRLDRWMSVYAIETTPVSAATVTPSSPASSSSPVNERRPSWSPRVRTFARRPRKRRKCSGLVSGRSVPGEETSSAYFSRTSGSCLVTRSHRSSVTPSGWSMNRRTRRPPTTSASSTSTPGSDSERRASISACIALMFTPILNKKAGERPLSLAARPRKSCACVIALARACAAWERASGGLGGPLSIDAIVAAFGPQLRRQRERFPRLLRAAQLEQRAPQAEQRVVVRGRAIDDGFELHAGRLELPRAEVRAPERLANRGLLGLEPRGLRQRHRGLVELPCLQERRDAFEEVVHVVHRTSRV